MVRALSRKPDKHSRTLEARPGRLGPVGRPGPCVAGRIAFLPARAGSKWRMSSVEFEQILRDAIPGLTAEAAATLWSSVLGSIAAALHRRRAVTLLGVLTLSPYVKGAKRYRHPITGEVIEDAPRPYVRSVLADGLDEMLATKATAVSWARALVVQGREAEERELALADCSRRKVERERLRAERVAFRPTTTRSRGKRQAVTRIRR